MSSPHTLQVHKQCAPLVICTHCAGNTDLWPGRLGSEAYFPIQVQPGPV